MNVISKRYIFLGFSGAMVLVSWLAIAVFGLRQGIDLQGGTEWHVAFSSFSSSTLSTSSEQIAAAVSEDAIKKIFQEKNKEMNVSVRRGEWNTFVVRLPDLTETEHQTYLAEFKKIGDAEEKSFSSIGPTIGSELRRKSIFAMIVVLLAISFYIAWAFRKVSEPVKSWKYGAVTLVTLLHDVSIPAGLLAFLGYFRGIEIDTNFIVALLVVMGFSVHDTIVVFDRIRENLLLNRGRRQPLDVIINYSIRETMARSINTSLTLVFILVALLVWGPSPLFYFVLTILVGTIFGTYSSIFVASPLLYLWQKK